MDLSSVKAEYEQKKQQLSEEIDRLMERADNYDELLETYEDKNDIDVTELEWGYVKDARHYDNLQNLMWVYERIVTMIDEVTAVGDDKKKAHRAKKDVETLITSVRKIKRGSNEIIEQEQQVISETNAALGLLDAIRSE